MWTISSSRARALAALLLLGGAPALAATAPPPAPSTPDPLSPLVIRRVSARRPGPALLRYAGPRFLRTAADPLAIEVRLTAPLDARPRDSAPVIVLNGQRQLGTWLRLLAADQLVCFLPDRAALRERNEVSVEWVGRSGGATAAPAILLLADIE